MTNVAVFTPGNDDWEMVEIKPSCEHNLGKIRQLVGGEMELGSCRPYQFAVGEWSHGSGLNAAATRFLGREIHGPCVVWGVDPGGYDADFEERIR